MKMLAVFGQLLQSVKEKLRKKDESSGTTVTGQASTTATNKTLIWGVMEGPYHISDFPEEELDDVLEEGYEWMLVCKIEEQGSLGLVNYWYPTLDEALAVKWYFDKNIEPLEVNDD
jgi:hypothetical protein